ncbi:MAG: hypothetical protein ACI4J8_02570 [Oscillospiraceae bacterium]
MKNFSVVGGKGRFRLSINPHLRLSPHYPLRGKRCIIALSHYALRTKRCYAENAATRKTLLRAKRCTTTGTNKDVCAVAPKARHDVGQ